MPLEEISMWDWYGMHMGLDLFLPRHYQSHVRPHRDTPQTTHAWLLPVLL